RTADTHNLTRFDLEADIREDRRVGCVAEADIPELDPTGEFRRRACAGQIADDAFNVEHFLNALVADHRIGGGVGHLREIAHGVVHLAQIPQEDDEHAGTERSGDGKPCAVSQYQ